MTSKLEVRHGEVCRSEPGGSPVVEAGWFGVEPTELVGLGDAQHVRHQQNPQRIDVVFAAGERVVGVELKRPADLLNSWRSRRLARQVRVMMETVDVVMVMVMGEVGAALFEQGPHGTLGFDLARLQMIGVVVVMVENSDGAALRALRALQAVIGGERSVFGALVGTDRRRERNRREAGWFLRNIRGIGPATSSALIDQFGSTLAALQRIDDWRVRQAVREEARRAMK